MQLAATRASEIEKFPIKITKMRFPEMLHVGDITKLKGSELPIVDVIAGGSPCQDLSVAKSNRQGLAGARSGLFMEQIRIVKEMRAESERRLRQQFGGTVKPVQIRPRYLLWENVAGAFSSTGGRDFLTVLQEISCIAGNTIPVPRPPNGRWLTAGCILGDTFSICWRQLSAEYWGVPQRRRRIFLVADFGGQSAPQIQFEQKRLFGNSAPGKSQGSDAASRTGCGSEVASGRISVERQEAKNQTSEAFGFWKGSAAERLSRDACQTANDAELALTRQQSNASISESVCPAITSAAGMSGNNQPIIYENNRRDARYNSCGNIAPTLMADMGTGGGNVPLTLCNPRAETYCIAGNIINREPQKIGLPKMLAFLGKRSRSGMSDFYALAQNERYAACGDAGSGFQKDIAYTLTTMDRHAVCFAEHEFGNYRKGCSTLRASGGYAGYGSENLITSINFVRRLTPLECERLQGFPDNWTFFEGAADSPRYKAIGNSVAIPCVDFIMRGIAYFLTKESDN